MVGSNNLVDTPLSIVTFSEFIDGKIAVNPAYKNSPLTWNLISFGELISPKMAFKVGRQMMELMKQHNGAGLAANQCGLNFPIIIVRDRILYRPKLLETSKSANFAVEGCLSFPGIQVEIERPDWITMSVIINPAGKRTTLKFWDEEARCAMHEWSHLMGKTIVDVDQ